MVVCHRGHWRWADRMTLMQDEMIAGRPQPWSIILNGRVSGHTLTMNGSTPIEIDSQFPRLVREKVGSERIREGPIRVGSSSSICLLMSWDIETLTLDSLLMGVLRNTEILAISGDDQLLQTRIIDRPSSINDLNTQSTPLHPDHTLTTASRIRLLPPIGIRQPRILPIHLETRRRHLHSPTRLTELAWIKFTRIHLNLRALPAVKNHHHRLLRAMAPRMAPLLIRLVRRVTIITGRMGYSEIYWQYKILIARVECLLSRKQSKAHNHSSLALRPSQASRVNLVACFPALGAASVVSACPAR